MMELGCQSAQTADNQQQRWVLASVVMCFNEGKNFCRTGIVMGFNWSVLRRYAWLLPLLAFLCTATYWRSLSLPLISDDYLQIELGRKYGPISSWPDLANDALYRCRATSIVVTHWTEQMFGVNPLWFNLSSLLIHFGNCSLVILLGFWRPIGFALSVPAACIFAFLQRPHEAVIWYAALPELLVFTFTLAALVAWILHCNSRQWHWFALSMAAFLLALLSKESAVVFVPLALLVAVAEPKRWWRLTPAIALSVLYFLAIYGDRQTHLHFNDGTFSLSAPFWSAELRTIGRLLGFWGTAALLVLAAWHRSWKLIGLCVLWMVITLLPYSFLTYQGLAPSRHAYMAAVGKAFLLGLAWLTLRERFPRHQAISIAVAAICVVQQTSYVSIYKYGQFLQRARPTERLVSAIEGYSGPVQLLCFPYPLEIAAVTLSVRIQNRAWLANHDEAAIPRIVDYCPSTD